MIPQARPALARLAWPFAWLLIQQSGLLLIGPPAGPDVDFSRAQVFGVFLVSLSFMVANLGFGAWLAGRVQASACARWMVALGAGTAISSLAAMALGALGLIAYGFAWLASLWILGGCWLAGQAFGGLPHDLRSSRVPVALFAAGLLLWLASASLANGTTDPFFYHLLGPRVWTDLGRLSFRAWYPTTTQASYWEYLFIWGNLLLGADGGKGLIPGQLFGQFIHVGLGVSLACASVYALTFSFTRRALWGWLAVLMAMCSSALDTFAFHAKNDYGCAGWALVGIVLLHVPGLVFPGKRRLELGLAGFFLGFAVLAKIVLVLPVGAAVAAWALFPPDGRRKPSDFAWVAGAAGLGMLPELLRNWILLGDPVFPFLVTRLGSGSPWAGPSALFLVRNEIGAASGDLRASLGALWEAHRHVPLLAPFFLLFPVSAWLRKGLRQGIALFLAVELSFVAYAGWRFGNAYLRWLAPALLVHIALAVFVLSEWVEALATRVSRHARKVRAIAFALPVLFIYSQFGFDWDTWERNIWRSVLSGNPPTIMLRNHRIHNGGDAMAWLRMNWRPGDRVATTGFQLLYYVSHLDVVAIPNHPAIDSATFGARHPLRVVKALREFGVTHLLDVAHWRTRYYAFSFGEMMARLAREHPSAVVYSTANSFILDLGRLEMELLRACGDRAPAREWEWYS